MNSFNREVTFLSRLNFKHLINMVESKATMRVKLKGQKVT